MSMAQIGAPLPSSFFACKTVGLSAIDLQHWLLNSKAQQCSLQQVLPELVMIEDRASKQPTGNPFPPANLSLIIIDPSAHVESAVPALCINGSALPLANSRVSLSENASCALLPSTGS
jgi:hypothetical protein